MEDILIYDKGGIVHGQSDRNSFHPYRILLAVRIDTFEAEIIDEIHCAPHEEFRKKHFEKLYSGYDNVVIVEIPA